MVHTSLALSLKLYKRAIDQGQAQQAPEGGGQQVGTLLRAWCRQLLLGPRWSVMMAGHQRLHPFHCFSPLVLGLGTFLFKQLLSLSNDYFSFSFKK